MLFCVRIEFLRRAPLPKKRYDFLAANGDCGLRFRGPERASQRVRQLNEHLHHAPSGAAREGLFDISAELRAAIRLAGKDIFQANHTPIQRDSPDSASDSF